MRGLLLLALLISLGLGYLSPELPASTAVEPAGSTTLPELAPDAWTLVMLPDIQSYVDHSANLHILREMMQWIVENKSRRNSQLVVQVGDLVYQNHLAPGQHSTGDQDSAEQWRNTREAFAILDGEVPYIVVPGNHDYGITNADDRSTQFTDYFTPAGNPLVDPARGGILQGLGPRASGGASLENAYYTLTAPDGRRMLFLALEWGPRQAAVDWAGAIASLPEYAGYTKVLVTHAYLYDDDTRYDWAAKGNAQSDNPHVYAGTCGDTHDGEELWNELVGPLGFQLVLCGHVGGDMAGYLASPNSGGQMAHQIMFNAQFLPQGGQGWLRLLEFQPDGRTVIVRTFSPYFASDGDPRTAPLRDSPEQAFSFNLEPQPKADPAK